MLSSPAASLGMQQQLSPSPLRQQCLVAGRHLYPARQLLMSLPLSTASHPVAFSTVHHRRGAATSLAASGGSSRSSGHNFSNSSSGSYTLNKYGGLTTKITFKSGKSAPVLSELMPPEHQEYWREQVASVDKPAAKLLGQHVDVTHLLGRSKPGGRKPPCYDYFLSVKRQFPNEIALTRVGEFYEAIGYDALFLVQYAGLNPMPLVGDMPRAGTARVNLRQTLSGLTRAGFTVAVSEEREERDKASQYGSKSTNTKERFISQHVSPSKPEYIYDMVLQDGSGYRGLDAPTQQLKGIAASKRGFILLEFYEALDIITVTESLSAEALLARVVAGTLATPLLVHSSMKNQPGALAWRNLSTMVKRLENRPGEYGLLKQYEGDVAEGFRQQVCREMHRPANSAIRVVSSSDADTGRPAPLYLSTANQLGLNEVQGMPSLLDALIGPVSPALARDWLRSHLLLPPPPAVAGRVHHAVQQLSSLESPLPRLHASLSPQKMVDVLKARQGSAVFFRELADMLGPVRQLLQRPEMAPLVAGLLPVVAWSHRRDLTPAPLLQHIVAAFDAVDAVVDLSPISANADAAAAASTNSTDGEEEDETLDEAIRKLTAKCEHFRNKVHARLIQTADAKVANAKARIEAEVSRLMKPLLQLSSKEVPGRQPKVVFAQHDRAIWLVLAPASQARQRGVEQLSLIKAKDRNGAEVPTRWTTAALDEALMDYRTAVEEATNAVRSELEKLCATLCGEQLNGLPNGASHLPDLVAACDLSIVGTALHNHVRQGMQSGWCLPTLVLPGQEASAAQASTNGSSASSSSSFEVSDMWPFWCQRDDARTVVNSFRLDNMKLLTGANMAGKSTLLRSTCAVALLGGCGLMVPAGSATVPQFDAFMLRNFSGDSPLEGKSSFAMEMDDVRCIINDAGARSLVLLDELGKGTEVRAGTAIAGALLEELAAKVHPPHLPAGGTGCVGIFATHLHGVVTMTQPLQDAGRLDKWAMEVVTRPCDVSPSGERRVPTWRMVPGECYESLAFEVALDMGVPPAFVQRAQQLYGKAEAEGARGHNAAEVVDVRAASPANPTATTDAVEGTTSMVGGNGSRNGQTHSVSAQTRYTLLAAKETLLAVARRLQSAAAGSSGTGGSSDTANPDGFTTTSLHNAVGSSGVGPTVTGAVAAAATASGETTAVATVCHMVGADEAPPPLHSATAAVYVIMSPSGWFYCGETDDVAGRLAMHRRRNFRKAQISGPGITAVYLLVPPGQGGKSEARQIQALTIRELQAANFPMASTADGKLVNFGR